MRRRIDPHAGQAAYGRIERHASGLPTSMRRGLSACGLTARLLAFGAVLALLLAVGAACAGRPHSHATGLLDTLRRHHDSLRWENYGGAALSVDPAFREGWMTVLGEIGRVSEYDIGGVDMKEPPGDDALAMIRVSGFRVPDMTVRTLIWRERWRRQTDDWHLVELTSLAPGPGPAL